MNKKWIVIIGLLVVVVAVIYAIVVNRGGREEATPVTTVEKPAAVTPRVTQVLPDDLRDGVIEEAPAIYAEFLPLAYAFADRYGSYSKENYGQNLMTLKPVMTAKMRAYVDGFKFDSQSAIVGAVTKALSAEVLESSDVSATVKLSTRRQETYELNGTPKTYEQAIVVRLVKNNGAWLVDEARWVSTD